MLSGRGGGSTSYEPMSVTYPCGVAAAAAGGEFVGSAGLSPVPQVPAAGEYYDWLQAGHGAAAYPAVALAGGSYCDDAGPAAADHLSSCCAADTTATLGQYDNKLAEFPVAVEGAVEYTELPAGGAGGVEPPMLVYSYPYTTGTGTYAEMSAPPTSGVAVTGTGVSSPRQYQCVSGAGAAPAARPQHSYIALISQAIHHSGGPLQRLLLADIYSWVQRHYPLLCPAGDKSWRNSIRHNLSINDCFVKCGRSENRSKGNYWTIHPDSRDEFSRGDYHRRRVRKRGRSTAAPYSPDDMVPGATQVQGKLEDSSRPLHLDVSAHGGPAARGKRSPFVPMTQTFVTEPLLERTFGTDML